MVKLTPKQKKFADNYLECGNATEAVLKAGYNVKDRLVAGSVGSENLQKPDIIAYFREKAGAVANNMFKLAISAESEQVQVAAGKDILDRAGYKPTERIDHTTKGESFNVSDRIKELADRLNEEQEKIC